MKLSNRPGVFKERREIIFYEASEGGAGVLRQLAEAPAVLPALARRALAICHYDPDTGEDRAANRCGRACCECLLDYGNHGTDWRAVFRRHADLFGAVSE